MYNPGGDGLAEFIELTNISTTQTLGMGNVHFNAGIDFNFTGSPITSLAPGARCVIVRNLAAFQAVHGNALSVAGVFAASTALSNGGELIKLEDPQGNTVKEFAYDDIAPWPAADATGASLVLMRPELSPDPANPLNWRASTAAGGNPGTDDARRFSGANGADNDHDGLSALVEYVFGSSDSSSGALDLHPVTGMDGAQPFIEITVTRQRNADDATFAVKSSSDLNTWSGTGWALRSSTPGADGAVTETWRLTGTAAGQRLYVRCECSHL